MKIIKIIGGLGNQMFQYAFYLSLKNKYRDEEIKLDINLFKTYKLHNGFELERVFHISAPFATPSDISRVSYFVTNYKLQRVIRKLFPVRKTEYIEKHDFLYQRDVFRTGDCYYEGYWQNYRYFNDIFSDIFNTFSFKNTLDQRNKIILEQISSNPQTVSIHIRRGDYINHKIFGNICDLEYYTNAIQLILQHCSNPCFYIFSNDILWCKNNLMLLLGKHQYCFVDWNIGPNNYIDMQLMSACKNNILANSSFSWWAAWLNSHSDKFVIAPKKWANSPYSTEVQPDSWTLI